MPYGVVGSAQISLKDKVLVRFQVGLLNYSTRVLARVFCMHMKLTEYNLLPNTPGIYYIKNTKNSKGYVGQSQNIRIRVRRHINLFKRKVYDAPLYKAFDKYGLDAFEVEVLLSITDLVDKFEIKNKLDEAEIYYIDKLNTYTYNHKGYNQTIGGDAGITGYKYTDEQRQHTSENSKRRAADGRFTIYCYDIINKEYITEVNTPALARRLNINIDNADIRRMICKKQYILARSKEKLEEKIKTYEEKLNSNSSDSKSKKESIQIRQMVEKILALMKY